MKLKTEHYLIGAAAVVGVVLLYKQYKKKQATAAAANISASASTPAPAPAPAQPAGNSSFTGWDGYANAVGTPGFIAAQMGRYNQRKAVR